MIPTCPVFDAETTIHTTAREMTRWLTMVWTDDAASLVACAQVRSLMALEIGHRWADVFDPSAAIRVKGGSLAGLIRNQIGVVEFPEGDAYAVAIFTRADKPFSRTNEVWRAIRDTAAKTVSELRAH